MSAPMPNDVETRFFRRAARLELRERHRPFRTILSES
jgi:hypothetical protein